MKGQYSPVEVRQAAIAGGSRIYHDTADLLKTFLANPIVEIVLLYALVHKLNEAHIIGGQAGLLIESAGITAVGLQQLAPMMPYIAPALAQSIASLGGLAGLAGVASKAAGVAALGAG